MFLLGMNVLFSQNPEILTGDSISIIKLDQLNSTFRETNISVSPDGKYLFWMSARGGQSWSSTRTKQDLDGQISYDGDIWYSVMQDGQWQTARCMPAPVNTFSGEDEPNISPNGRYVYYQSWSNWENRGGPYYRAEIRGNKWGNLKGFGGGVHTFFREMMAQNNQAATDGATISPDGKTFIVAAAPDYTGNMDLYISRLGEKGWSYPEKLPFCTEKDERSAFLAADGQTLYFASDGYGGEGGLDLFKVTLNTDGTTGEVISLGKPFNTPENDYNFVLTASGNAAFFIRNGDIHYADISHAREEIKPQPTVLIKGIIVDSVSNRPVTATITLTDSSTQETIAEEQTNPRTGEYVLVIPDKPRTYEMEIKSPQFKPRKSYVDPGETRTRGQNIEIVENIPLVREIKTVENPNDLISDLDTVFFIYFDTDQDSLNPLAVSNMQEIIATMKHYRAGQVKLLGHTDARGSLDYNRDLSERRVMSVANYLIGQKYPASRIVSSHFGEERPASDNTTVEGMQLNRRVEVRFAVRKKEE